MSMPADRHCEALARGIGLGAYALVYAVALVVLAREPGGVGGRAAVRARRARDRVPAPGTAANARRQAPRRTRSRARAPRPAPRWRGSRIFAFAVLGWGFSAVRAAVAAGTAQELAILAAKLLAMVRSRC